jgi:hypothetical protein
MKSRKTFTSDNCNNSSSALKDQRIKGLDRTFPLLPYPPGKLPSFLLLVCSSYKSDEQTIITIIYIQVIINSSNESSLILRAPHIHTFLSRYLNCIKGLGIYGVIYGLCCLFCLLFRLLLTEIEKLLNNSSVTKKKKQFEKTKKKTSRQQREKDE